MTEQERQEIKANPLAGLKTRPPNVNTNDWKNRFRISTKLVDKNYKAAYALFLRKKDEKHERGFSWSSGMNYLIATHPEIIQIKEELKSDA